MAKYLVVPSPATLAVMPRAAATAAAAGAAPSLRATLAARRAALEQFAGVLLTAPAAVSAMAVATAEEVPETGYEVLEALGALIVDSDVVDLDSARASLGVTIFENVQIPLIQPEPGETAAGPAEANGFWHLDHIRIEAARTRGLHGGGVLVGVLDTGIDPDHPEFAGKTVHFQEFDRLGKTVGSIAYDTSDHGTHVSALIAGRRAGVAPAADIAVAAVLTIPTTQGQAGTLVQISRGLNWLLTESFRGPDQDPGVDILNASLGGSGYDAYLYTALATARFATGDLLVGAIGNSGRKGRDHHGSPGNYDIVLGVGAVDRHDQAADFSDWGSVPQHGGKPKPDLSAPGVDVLSAVPGGGYASMSGTSMAAPIVTGAGALLIEQSPARAANASALEAAILALVRPPAGPRVGRGVLDLSGI